MAVPIYVDDGNYTIPQENNAPVYSFPFTRRGDFKSFTARVTKRIDWRYYEPPISMNQRWFDGLGVGFLVDFTPPSGIGQGLLEWGEVYASVPVTGIEYHSANYTVQTYKINPLGTDSELFAYNDTFDAKYVYEYSAFKPLPQILYPRLQLMPRDENAGALTVCVVGTQLILGARATDNTTPGKEVLAQNTTSKIYMGEIFERLSIFVLPSYPRVLQVAVPP